MSKPKKPESNRFDQIVDNLYQKIQRRTITESSKIGYETAQCMRSIISHCTSLKYSYYIKLFRRIGLRLQSAQPIEFIISNVIRRILYQFRRIAQDYRKKPDSVTATPLQGSLIGQSISTSSITESFSFLSESLDTASLESPQPRRAAAPVNPADGSILALSGMGQNVSPPVNTVIPAASPVGQGNGGNLGGGSGNISKLLYENENIKGDFTFLKSERDQIRAQLVTYIENTLMPDIKCFSGDIKSSRDSEQIHPSEVVMVYGGSNTVREYLINRSIKLADNAGDFEVYVAEAAPSYNGHRMAADLAYGGLKTTLIPDTAISAMMPRVNKVIVGVHAIMMDGGLVGQAGLHAVALAAKAHSVPLVVVSSTFKITPILPTNKDFLASMDSPSTVFSLDKMASLKDVEVVVPRFDYVPPELVSLIITNGLYLCGKRHDEKEYAEVPTKFSNVNLIDEYWTEKSTNGELTYFFCHFKKGAVNLRKLIENGEKYDPVRIKDGIMNALRYLAEQNLTIKNLCTSSIMICENQTPVIFDLRYIAKKGKSGFPEPCEEDFDYFKDYFTDEKLGLKCCLRLIYINLFARDINNEALYFEGEKSYPKELKKHLEQLEYECFKPECNEFISKLDECLCKETLCTAIKKSLKHECVKTTTPSFDDGEEHFIMVKNRFRHIFRLHGAVLTNTALFKVLNEDPDKLTKTSLSLSSGGSLASLSSDQAMSSPSFSDDPYSTSSISSLSLSSSKHKLSSSSVKRASSKSTLDKKCKKVGGKKLEREPVSQYNDVIAIKPDGKLIKIANGNPEFRQKINSAGRPLRTYSFSTGLFEVDGNLEPVHIAEFSIQETLSKGNEPHVLATLEAEFFVVLCACLREYRGDVTILLSYSKDARGSREKVTDFVGKKAEYDKIAKSFNDLQKTELKELSSVLSEIKFFSTLSGGKFYFVPAKPDFPNPGLIVQVMSNDHLIADGKCEISDGDKVYLSFRIFLNKVDAWVKMEDPRSDAPTPDLTSVGDVRTLDSRHNVFTVTNMDIDVNESEHSTCRNKLNKVCIIIESNDEKYVGSSIACSLWDKNFEVTFMCGNENVDELFADDLALGWSIVVKGDGSILLVKRREYKEEKIAINVGNDAKKCIDIIVRTSRGGETNVIASFLKEVSITVEKVKRTIKKKKKSATNTFGENDKGGNKRFLSEKKMGASGIFDEYEEKEIKQYYAKHLGEFVKHYSRVFILVMEKINFSEIIDPLFNESATTICYQYTDLFSRLFDINKADRKTLVVIVNHDCDQEDCDRYNKSLVITPENLEHIKKKYRKTYSEPSSLDSAPSSLASSSSSSESSLSSLSSSSSPLGLTHSSESLPSLSHECNPKRGEIGKRPPQQKNKQQKKD